MAADAEVRGDAALAVLERPFLWLDRALARALPDELNPFLNTGAVALTTLVVATVTGVLLLFWYRPSVHLAYDSLAALEGARFSAGLLRSLHRYSSDACLFFALVHALRLLGERRFTGARWLAWVTGVASLGVLWVLGWTGYWLVWDVRAKYVAVETAKALDALPIFADPMSRSFLFDEGINSLLFFVVFFFHMLAPLALGLLLWLHLTRTARPRFLTRAPLTLWVLASLVGLSLAWPATNAERARMTARGESFTMDWWYLFPIALGQRMSGGAIWAVCLAGGALVGSAPWALRRRTAPSAAVEPSRCNACEQCYQDCPYEAISMEPRDDPRRRERYALEARVDPAKCVGCGICVASCNSIGTDLLGFPLRDQRERIADWLEQAGQDGEAAGVAFACAHSAGAGLEIDPDTGRCRELPGWRVLEVPCAGWVHTMTLERALRRGARQALVVGCPPGSCHFREGPQWLGERLDAGRSPALRTELAARDRITVLALDRTRRRELVRAAARLLAGERPAPAREPGRALAGLGAALLAILVGALLGVASDASYSAPADAGSELVVTFKHPGQHSDVCRERSAEELERMPRHMRQALVCERARAPVRLRVSVDGRRLVDERFAPQGLWSDGNSVAIATLAIEPGEHGVVVELADGHDGEVVAYRLEERLRFDARARRVVAFERVSGFTVH